MKGRKLLTSISVVLFLLFSVWWIALEATLPMEDPARDPYSLTYGVLAGWGGIIGFIVAKRWGGFKSYVGKSLIFFSFGLLCQFLGQNAYSIQYMIDHVENSYPSYGEIFFFISMPSYILGVLYIAKAAGSGVKLQHMKNKIFSAVFSMAMVVISYLMFIKGTFVDGQPFLITFLGIAYPVGQATFVSIAIIAYLFSGKLLGGVMKRRVVFILASLVFQYIADSIFLYKSIQGTWYHADISEFMFAASYSFMTFAFLDFSSVFGQLKDGA